MVHPLIFLFGGVTIKKYIIYQVRFQIDKPTIFNIGCKKLWLGKNLQATDGSK
jgi:hypothetical protein